MFNIGDYLIYKNEVCAIKDIREKYFNGNDCYVLIPNYDKSLTINVPVSNDNKFLRPIISREEVYEIISNIPHIETVDVIEKQLDSSYKELLNSMTHEDLIKIIKTAYLRNEDRIKNNLKVKDKDNVYLELAERLLYSEFSIALDKSYEETKEFVINEVRKISCDENEK